MKTPILHVVAGPNGSGKSTFVAEVLEPVTHLPFINADLIAGERWPHEEAAHAYDAARIAASMREEAIAARTSFITETVFSHRSKVELIGRALSAGYLVELQVMLVPEELAVRRVAYRVDRGGHAVPERKVRERYRRLWGLVAEARTVAHRMTVYDNTRSDAFKRVAAYERGRAVGVPEWPAWTPQDLR